MWYSQYLAKNLSEREINTVKLFSEAIKSIASNQDPNDNTAMEFFVVDQLGNVPVIMEDEQGKMVGYNYGDEDAETRDQEFLLARKEKIIKKGYEPIDGYGSSHKIYYENSKLYQRISLFPLAQILLLSTFFIFGYYIFSTSRRSEQNRVWAGMSKETAHQLGTPISAIIGWIEHLKEMSHDNPDQMEVIAELRNDVNRLELIADRFSKIGSKPELIKTDLIEKLDLCKDYMQRRAPKRIIFDFPSISSNKIFANINIHLFDWVIENILRNALDAMDGKGQIKVELAQTNNQTTINISDTGKGIRAGKLKSIFDPGFTTKKRGWGLGLSLAKRIIENYHNGKIFVKQSKLNEGTTFTIQLPTA